MAATKYKCGCIAGGDNVASYCPMHGDCVESQKKITMDIKQAISTIKKYHPCPHESYSKLGIGQVWSKCDDCGMEFEQERLENHRKASAEFDEAIEVLETISKYVPAKHGVDCKKAEHVGGGYHHRDDDDSHYTIGGWVYCGRCHEYLGDE